MLLIISSHLPYLCVAVNELPTIEFEIIISNIEFKMHVDARHEY